MNDKDECIIKKDKNSDLLQDKLYEISFIELIVIIWKKRFFIILCTLLVTIGGFLFAIRAPVVFSSNALFVTKMSQSSNNANFSQLASLAGISMPSNGNIDPSEYLDKIIQDQSFLSKLFERKWRYKGDSLFLDQILHIKKDTTLPDWSYRFFISKIETIRSGRLITINKDPKTGILTLLVSMPDPKLAYDINTYTIDFLSSYMRNSLQTQAKEKRLFIEERIKETKDELSKSENALVQFKERNQMSTSPKVMIEEGRLARQVTLNQEIYLQFKKQYELAKLQELDDQTLIQIVKNPEIPIVKSRPKKAQIVVISFVIGCFLSLFFAFFIEVLPNIYKKII